MTASTDSDMSSGSSSSSADATPGVDFLTFVLERLVEDKDQLKIDHRVDDLGILLTVSVSPSDMGKLIGKSGQTIKSLRTLLRTLGGKHNQRINLKVMEPGDVS